ncbi:hypothetical protein AB0F32_08420 [Streptomyces albidoflavus]|uniref:hypothetical protein n=1 Tax=Streptomyces TaxID=1883 RepID=UPI00028300D8|nr:MULTISPECIES: hypothetical protein [Streptomyces]KUL66736.1 hypothetical protein ADL32_03985 [Streptomyces albidoflavus]MDI3346375.1 hypothetical protein [Streptomyces sp. AJ-1]PJT52307.1 hypothetical protein CWI85_02625 [Streptomyces albidoflavus]PKA35877.1 hypothetical protein SM8_017545 [Streptomyces sp. SM8]RZD60498.1 hypothetical protein C0Q59_15570 [Streptomyces albidoflavus]
MRKFTSAVTTTALLCGSIGLAAGQAAAATGESAESQAAAACVTVVKWSSEKSSRYVTVKNSCSTKKCFTVTIALRTDPQFTVGAKKQEKFRYGGTLGNKGTGIKNVAC